MYCAEVVIYSRQDSGAHFTYVAHRDAVVLSVSFVFFFRAAPYGGVHFFLKKNIWRSTLTRSQLPRLTTFRVSPQHDEEPDVRLNSR